MTKMKRYRVLTYRFDARANVLKQEIQDDWEERVIAQWQDNKRQIKAGLIGQYGAFESPRKIENFIELGWLPISVIAFHNNFLQQIRDAYIVGAYYPSLTGACALGERILNQLIIHLRDDFKGTKEYKNVYRKDSFDNWDVAINTLESWSVLLPEVVADFRELKETRNRVIHFNPETDRNEKQLATVAVKRLTKIVEGQFSGFGTQPWFIPNIAGAAYIKKQFEEQPFVKRILLPSCERVGPYHRLQLSDQGWVVQDDYPYENKEISDEEFAKLLPGEGS